jgi:hypothetical protein
MVSTRREGKDSLHSEQANKRAFIGKLKPYGITSSDATKPLIYVHIIRDPIAQNREMLLQKRTYEFLPMIQENLARASIS